MERHRALTFGGAVLGMLGFFALGPLPSAVVGAGGASELRSVGCALVGLLLLGASGGLTLESALPHMTALVEAHASAHPNEVEEDDKAAALALLGSVYSAAYMGGAAMSPVVAGAVTAAAGFGWLCAGAGIASGMFGLAFMLATKEQSREAWEDEEEGSLIARLMEEDSLKQDLKAKGFVSLGTSNQI